MEIPIRATSRPTSIRTGDGKKTKQNGNVSTEQNLAPKIVLRLEQSFCGRRERKDTALKSTSLILC